MCEGKREEGAKAKGLDMKSFLLRLRDSPACSSPIFGIPI